MASIIEFIVNKGIQFMVTPILMQSVGDEAYGFITIENVKVLVHKWVDGYNLQSCKPVFM